MPRADLRKRLHRELSDAGRASDATFERLDAVARALQDAAAGQYHMGRELDIVLAPRRRTTAGVHPPERSGC